ncbi:MAG: glycosyltransferase family 4 protein [Phycisphaerae bacterium]|nr:glycosyltransferase family 4 protein [Phycisphaerae bacterium]
MRIALLSWEAKHAIAVGGLAEHVSELAEALSRRGHEVHVYTRMGPGQGLYDCIGGVHIHRCPFDLHDDFLHENQRMCESFAWHVIETESFLGKPFDVIHGHDWLSVRALVHLKNRHGRPVVLTIHSTEYGRCGNQLWEGPSRAIRDIEWEGTYVANRMVCVSGALRREVQWLYSTPPDKIDVIYNGVDVTRFDGRINNGAIRHRYAVGRSDPMVLFAGRLTRQKGPDILMEALPEVLQRHPQTKFVFAGDGDMRHSLESRSHQLHIDGSTRFLGHQSGRSLVQLFKTADTVCVPSRNEPFGIVILEAWSARRPVVATRNGGPGEFVRHERNGLTVADDAHDIGTGLDTVLSSPESARRMGRNGRREAETRFSWHTVAAATERVYQSISAS